LEKIDLNSKEKYRALAFKIWEEIEHENQEKILKDFEKLIEKYNKDLIKKEEKILKDKIKLWDSEAFLQYNELQKKLKKLNNI
jgi:DNA primase catalytic subunit